MSNTYGVINYIIELGPVVLIPLRHIFEIAYNQLLVEKILCSRFYPLKKPR